MQATYGSRRCGLIQKAIFEAFLAVGQTPPAEVRLLEMIGVWAKVLALKNMPDDKIDEYVTRAISRKKGGFLVNVSDICEEWDRLAENRRIDAYLFNPKDRGKY